MCCERCGIETQVHMMSMFNKEKCCLSCIELEKAHPMYIVACKEEIKALSNGNWNYDGIGLPKELEHGQSNT